MSKLRGYGWLSYYFNLLRLTGMSHHNRVKFIKGKAQVAAAVPDPERRLRLLLHCTDWPLDLLQATPTSCICKCRCELEELQRDMVSRYQEARLKQHSTCWPYKSKAAANNPLNN